MTEDFKNLSLAELKQRGMPPKQVLAEMKRRGMSPQEFIDGWSPKPPVSSRVGSRSLRRKVVSAMYGSYVLAAMAMQLSFQAPGKSMTVGVGVLAFVAVAAATFSNLWLGRRTYVNSPALNDRELDERLVQIKNQVYRTAYQIIAPLVVVAWLLSLLLVWIEASGQGIFHAVVIYGGLTLLVTTLPTSVMAWREPDPAEPEQLEV